MILYARGYRLSEVFKLFPTGGLYVSVGQSGVNVYLDDEPIKKTNIFQKTVFVQNLKPSEYKVSVSKEGFQGWEKILSVYPETVTEVRPFILPEEPILIEVLPTIPSSQNSTSTSASSSVEIVNPEYENVSELFTKKSETATTTNNISTSTDKIKTVRKFSIESIDDSLFIKWTGNLEDVPAYFCQSNICNDEIVIKMAYPIKKFDFFPGRDDLIIVGLLDGIFVTELDIRSKQNIATLALGDGLDFRVVNGDKIYIRKGKQFFLVSL